MVINRSLVFIFASALTIAVNAAASAEDLPTMSLRYMTVEADVIVIGEPVDADKEADLPAQFKVVKVLQGPASLQAQKITLNNSGDVYTLAVPWARLNKDVKRPEISKALLFLREPGEGEIDKGYLPVLSGIRAMSNEGEMLVPQQIMNPGPQHLVPSEEVKWEAMLDQVERDLPKIANIRALDAIEDKAERNQAILRWIDEHRAEFANGGSRKEEKGWGTLEGQLFDWVMESRIPGDCWRALELSLVVKRTPYTHHSSFCSVEGRGLLLEKMFDEKASEQLRLLALKELGKTSNYWCIPNTLFPLTRTVSREEQLETIDRIAPLLEHENTDWRRHAVQALLAVSWPNDGNHRGRETKRAIPLLVDLYRIEDDAGVRRACVEAFRRLEDEAFWQKLSGNPHGIVVNASMGGDVGDDFRFQLNLYHTRATLTEVPQFRFEKLNKNREPIETRLVLPTVVYPNDRFTSGWDTSQGFVSLMIPKEKLAPGQWRVRAEGRIGDKTWRSEPIKCFVPDEK